MAELGTCVSLSQAPPKGGDSSTRSVQELQQLGQPLSLNLTVLTAGEQRIWTPEFIFFERYSVQERRRVLRHTEKPTPGSVGLFRAPVCSPSWPQLPVDVFLPVIRRRRGVRVRAGKHDVALALVHHAARLLVVVERHRRGRHRLDVDGDICFAVRKKITR